MIKFGGYMQSKFIMLVVATLLLISCNSSNISTSEFNPWSPKQIDSKVTLIEKWSVDYDKSIEDLSLNRPKVIDFGTVSSEGWFFSSGLKVYSISNDGIKTCRNNYSIDDVENGYSIINHSNILTGMDSINMYDKNGFVIWSIGDVSFTKAYVYNNLLYGISSFKNHVFIIDVEVGILKWKKQFDHIEERIIDEIAFKDDLFIINTTRNANEKISILDGQNFNSYLVHDNGELEAIDKVNNTIATSTNDKLYAMINGHIFTELDPEKITPIGKRIDINEVIQNGSFYVSPPIKYLFTSFPEERDLYYINLSNMSCEKVNGKMICRDQYPIDGKFIFLSTPECFIGLNNKTFEKTWTIDKKSLDKNATIILGDERGILVKSNNKLICFGEKDKTE
jgi:hypothetical protein